MFSILSLERTAPIGATNPQVRLTRRGFFEWGSAVASAGLVGNGYAESVLRGEIVLDSVKPSSEPLAGKIALEEHLPKLSNQVMQLETFTPKRDRKSSISTADVRVFGIGCWRSGGELSLAGARNAGSHGRTSSFGSALVSSTASAPSLS